MKYEDIKVGESYYTLYGDVKVLAKIEETKEVVAIIERENESCIWRQKEYCDWKPLTPELPDEGLVVLKGNENYIIYRTGKGTGYGFKYGMYYIVEDENGAERWSFKNHPEKWRPATEEEGKKFNELLKKECERRGLYEDTKIKAHANDFKASNPGDYESLFDVCVAYNRNGCIFQDGIFAEPLAEDQTLDTKIKELIELGKDKGLKINVTFE